LAGDGVGQGESGVLYGMRELEDHAQNETGYHREDGEADHPVIPAQPVDGQHDKDERVERLESPENEMVAQAHFLQEHGPDLAFERFLVIGHEYPEDVEDAI